MRLQMAEAQARDGLGGAGTVLGPIVGPTFLVVVSSGLRSLSPALSHVVYGVILIVVIIVLPTGIVGGAKKLLARLGRRGPAQP